MTETPAEKVARAIAEKQALNRTNPAKRAEATEFYFKEYLPMIQGVVDEAVLAEAKWWAEENNGGNGLCDKEIGCSECNPKRERLEQLEQRARGEPGEGR